MGLNNQMYALYADMKRAYANDDSGSVEQFARCWLQLAPENPFKQDTPEFEEFFQMQKCYMIWFRGDIDQRINRRRMIQHAKALCALNVANPYKFSKEEARRDLEEKKLKEASEIKAIEEQQEEIKEELPEKTVEKKVVLGIIPDEVVEKKEKKSWFRFLNPWKKDGE